MNKHKLGIQFASIACAVTLAGCATNDQGLLVIDPDKFNAVITAAVTPPPPPPQPAVVVAAPVAEEVYEPAPDDVYIVGVADRDVVFVGGDTFIWVVGPDGVRHRRFYAHGDRRQEVFHRRDDLHRVVAHHDGHLPDHPIGAPGAAARGLAEHGPADRPGAAHPPLAAQARPGPGAVPARMAPVSKPAPGKPAPDKDKKS